MSSRVPEPPDLPEGITRAQVDGLPELPTWGDPELRAVDFAESYAQLVALTQARVRFLGALLEQQFNAEGVAGLVGKEYEVAEIRDGKELTYERVPTGKESLRALVELEGKERERLAKYLRDGIRIGLEAKQADAMRRVGTWLATSLRNYVSELGLDWEDEGVRRAAQRAVLSARAAMGAQGGVGADAAAAGPPLSREERARALGHAAG